jgi:hypothetical protein
MSPPVTPPTTPRKSHKKLWITLGVIAAVLLIISISTSGKSAAPATPAAAPTVAVPAAPVPAAPVPPAVPAPSLPPAPAAPSVPAGPLTTFGNGTYEIGVDVAAGKYRSAGVQDSIAPLCYFDQTDASGSIKDQGVANEGPSRATLKSGLTFKSSGCQDWVKVG